MQDRGPEDEIGDDGREPSAAIDRRRGPERLEAFSDGVFAIAITLLVLEIRVPTGDQLDESGQADQGARCALAELRRLPHQLRDDRDHLGEPPQPVPPRGDA